MLFKSTCVLEMPWKILFVFDSFPVISGLQKYILIKNRYSIVISISLFAWSNQTHFFSPTKGTTNPDALPGIHTYQDSQTEGLCSFLEILWAFRRYSLWLCEIRQPLIDGWNYLVWGHLFGVAPLALLLVKPLPSSRVAQPSVSAGNFYFIFHFQRKLFL